MSQLTVTANTTAGANVRRAVASWMAGHPRLDDALLAVTELVNNAVMYGGLTQGDSLIVRFGPEGEMVRLTVEHVGLRFEVDRLPPPSFEPGASRGLAIVDRIADGWGVHSDGGEVTAWFEVGPRMPMNGAGSRKGSGDGARSAPPPRDDSNRGP